MKGGKISKKKQQDIKKFKLLAGTDPSPGAAFFLYESVSDWDLAVRSGSVRFSISDDVRRGAI